MSEENTPNKNIITANNFVSENAGSPNWTSSAIGKLIATGLLAAEITPFNEIARFSAYGIALKYSDPEMAALVAGASTFTIEGSAAVVAADVLDTDLGKQTSARINNKLHKLGIEHDTQSSPATDVGIALLGGSAIATAVKNQNNGNRSRSQNRKYGLTAAAGISLMTAGQAYAVGEGITHPSPVAIGLAAVAIGASITGYRWAKNKLTIQFNQNTTFEKHDTSTGFNIEHVTNEPLTDPDLIQNSAEAYSENCASLKSPQQLGLSREDTVTALSSPRAIKALGNYGEGEKIAFPLLVPISDLYWFNKDFLRDSYHTDNIYYLCCPPELLEDKEELIEAITTVIDNNGIVIYGTAEGINGNKTGEIRSDVLDQKFHFNTFGNNGDPSFLNQYDGKIICNKEGEDFQKIPSTVAQQYRYLVSEGRFTYDSENGPAIEEVIQKHEAEKLWEIYNEPFKKLGQNHPVGAGFDKQGFIDMLKDPEVIKVIHREDGAPTTLATFITSFKHAPWLNEAHYKHKYPEAYETGNILIFTGIVADQTKKTGMRSLALIDLLIKTASTRNTANLITFECSEVSARYTPKIVQLAVAKAGGKLRSMGVQSQLKYHSISRKATK